MNPPSLSLLRCFSPAWSRGSATGVFRGCLYRQTDQRMDFSSTQQRMKKKGGGPRRDTRVSLIRYFLNHPLTPRPLRFSRSRNLRHWTIHRAWQLYQAKLRTKRTTELAQQYQSMKNACEALRLIDKQGLTAEERSSLGMQEATAEAVGKLYRVAMLKPRIWDNVPIEYAKIQTDTPSREGWNHAWTR